ncbi:unnamed protein product [Orchesella dallaii]|uniref:Guanylate-binding protein N-terminal domain-containing protein n=1 Tax=Orchesella dallaii TaxID=48710 RepID=A0ABP1PLF2_9HEXA
MTSPTTSQGDQRSCHLRKHSKIVSYSGGNFTLHHENLAMLGNSMEAAKFDPVALISVIGPAESGKSLYTNLLIHYFEHRGAGAWITNLSLERSKALNIVPLLGFSYGNIHAHNIISPYSDSGIYLWPEAFRVSNYNGNIIVWVLNVHLTEHDRADETIVELFNVLLTLLSSKIVEIKWKNDGFTFLETRHKLLNSNFPSAMFCKDVVQLCRTSEKPEKFILSTDTEAMEHLQKLIPKTLLTTLESLDSVRVVHLKDNNKPLHDRYGFLILHARMHERLDKTIKLIGEFNDIKPKLDMTGQVLCMCEMGTYVFSCVEKVNQAIMKHQQNKALNTTSPGCSSFSSTPGSTSIEISSSKLYPDIKDDLNMLNSSNSSPKPNSSPCPFEVYDANRSSGSCDRFEEMCGNNEKDLNSQRTKEQALRKEKLSKDNCGGDKFLHIGIVSEPNRKASISSTVCANEKVKESEAIVEGEPMDIGDNSTIDNAVKNVEEEATEQLKQNEEAKRIFQEESKKKAEALETLQAKLETEEKKRLEEEQKQMQKEKMEKLAVDACVEIEAGMLKELNNWLNHTLCLSTINECGKMYEQQLLKIKNDIKCREVLGTKRQARFYKVLQEKTQELRMRFEKIQEFITSFNSSINSNSETYGYFTESSFNELIDREFVRIRGASGSCTNEELMKYAFGACEKLAYIYKVQNRNIITQEQFLLRLQCKSITDIYNIVMGRIIGESYFSPVQLSRIHSQLIRKLIKSLTTAFRFNATEPNQVFTKMCGDLMRHLEEEFKPHKINNRLKLEKLQRELSKLLTSSKAVYDGTMDKALRDNCGGLLREDFMNIHSTAVEEAKKSLKKGIREKVGEVEKVGVHVETLQIHIDDAWPSLMEENGINLRKFKEKRQQQDVDMAQRNDSTQETRVDTKSIFNSSHSSTYKNTTRNGKVNEDKKCLPELKRQPIRSPLIFHLSLNHVRAGMYHENEFLPSEPTPAIVGITKDNQWVCGQDNLQEDSIKVWFVRECFHPWKEDIRIGDTNYTITIEFLLGVLFQALKLKFEDMLNVNIDKAFIIIPFWFTSSQRRQVKDAGIIGGFNETLLINENTAIALHHAIKNCNKSTEIVVLSENSGHVNITVYDYDKENLKMRMRGHYPVYEKKDKKKKANPSVFTRSLNYFLGSSTSDSEVSDGTLHRVKEAYKLAMAQADSLKKKSDRPLPKHAVCSFELNNWKDTLLQTTEGIIDRNYVFSSQWDDVMNGIGSITQNSLRVYDIIQDLMNSDICMKSPFYAVGKIVQDNNKVLPFNGLEFSADLPLYAISARFYQKVITGDADIGQLQFHPYPEDACVKLEVSNEGIVSLLSVNPKPKNSVRTRGSGIADKPPFNDSHFTWITPTLKNDAIAVFASLLAYFNDAKKALVASSETELAKQSLFEKGQALTYRIDNNEVKFRSELGRTMVKDQIKEALGLLKHPKITKNDIEKQMELFQKLEAKYFPQ